jgi:5-methylcytosine-specific restriction protein A
MRLPLRPCSAPGCRALTAGGRCEAHRAEGRRAADLRRGSARERLYTTAWDKASRAFIAANPICVDPFGVHGLMPALTECTDHIIPHKGDLDLFWDQANWQPLCKRCNDRKGDRIVGRR